MSARKVIAVVSMLAIFILGGVSVLAFPIASVSNFKQEVLRKLGVVNQQVTFPEIIDSSRYQFSLESSSSLDGVFQLAAVDSSNFFALDRFSGKLYSFSLVSDVFEEKYLGNVYDQLGFFSESEASLAGQRIDNAGNKKSANPTIFATAFDIDYAFERIYLSVTLPSQNQTCTSLNLYSFTAPSSNIDILKDTKLLFTSPCVLDKKNPTMWAGRITHSPTNLYLSVGEQRYDPSGFPKDDKISISEIAKINSTFGKVLEFEPGRSSYTIFSSGHRNSQGLYYSKDDGQLVESEHGPFGGDEVNILKEGDNYGWPFGTFGKPYPLSDTDNKSDQSRSVNPASTIDRELNKFGAISGSQPGAHLPIMSWFPGVGAANITKVQKNSGFADWHGNILVSLMADNSIHRLILSRNSVVLDERISLGIRVRDFIVNDQGYLILSSDEGRLLIYKTTSSEFPNIK